VAPGYYGSRLWVQNVHGSPDAMIEVVALNPNDRPVFEAHESACFTLYDCSYILVDGIIAQGAGTPTSDGNNIEFPYGSHMILKNSLSRDVVHTGNSDGVKFAHSDNILMYNCTVTEWGEGGSGVDGMISNSELFMRNTFTFPSLPTYAGANGIMPKGAAYHIGMYKNHFIDGSSRSVCFGGSGGATGPEVYDSVAMGNVIEAGEAAVAYVSCRNCEFAYNTIVNPENYVMRILKEGVVGASDNIFRRNLIQYGNVVVQNIGPGNDAASFTYAEDYWYKYTNPAGSIPTLAAPETDPAGGTDPQLDGEQRPLYGPAKAYGAHAPAMEAEFAQYQSWFQWAWDKAMEYEPRAEPGGPYKVGIGGTITLDASGSYAGAGSYGAYSFDSLAWDLDYDGDFDDGSGQSVQVTYDQLMALGLGDGAHTIELRVAVSNEYNVIVDYGATALEIATLLGDANGNGEVEGGDYTIWADHYLASPVPAWADGGYAVGNFNDDASVDGADYTLWADNYGVGGLSVPEPALLTLLAAAAPALLRRR